MDNQDAMRIAYVSGNAWPGRSAGITFSFFNAVGFARAGADFVCYVRGCTSDSVEHVTRNLFEVDGDVPVRPIRAPRLAGSRWLYFLRVYRALKRSNRDIIITRSLNFLPWALRLKKSKGIRVYFESHNFWSDLSVRGGEVPDSRKRKIKLEQRCLPDVDGIICVSEPQARLYRNAYPDKKVICALPGCRQAVESTRTEFSHTLGYIGSFAAGKYPIEIVMEALARLSEPKIRLVCVGGRMDDAKNRLQAEASRLGIEACVEVHSWLSGRKLDAAKSRIDVGIAVLSDSFLNRIASPLKVFEYLSSGIPFIASGLEGIEMAIGNAGCGLLVDNTAEAWAGAIKNIYSDFSSYRKKADKCYEFSSTHGWKERAEIILETLQ